jgi:hypothetical protein
LQKFNLQSNHIFLIIESVLEQGFWEFWSKDFWTKDKGLF